jgi:macrolide transport system ATP-binding/permease protein
MGTFWQDFRYAVRLLLKKPGFTAVAVLSLALGIGANTAIFTLVKGVFLQSVPVKDPGRVVAIYSTQQMRGKPEQHYIPLTYLNARDYRDMNDVFSGMAISIPAGVTLRVGNRDLQVFAELVNYNIFDVLGVRITEGRGFTAEEDQEGTEGSHPVVVLRYGFWQNQFGADPNILGKTIQINGQPYTVVGIAPKEFHDIGTLFNPDVWAPMMMHDQILTGVTKDWFNQRAFRMCFAVARLKPGVTLAAAQASMHALGDQLARVYPHDNSGRSNDLVPLSETNIAPQQRSVFALAGTLMMVTVGLILLIACANVANLLLSRATQRRRELAIRLSMGASRTRLIRQLLTESLLLGLLAGAFGVLISGWVRNLIVRLLPGGLPGFVDTSIDLRVLLFALLLAIGASVLFGLVPALQASNPNQMTALRDRTDAPGGATHWYGLRGMLVITQVSLSLIALVGAGLFIHSLKNAQNIDPGFETKHAFLIGLNPASAKYQQGRAEQYYQDVLNQVRALPMVASAALSDSQLFGGGIARTTFPEGVDQNDPRNGTLTPIVDVTPGYFSAMGVPLLTGRAFDLHDDANSHMVAVVNQAFVEQNWSIPPEKALGKRLHFLGETWDVEVVGVAKTVTYATLGEPPTAVVYMPLKQHYNGNVFAYVRTNGDPRAALPSVREKVRALDPSMPLTTVQTVADRLDQSLGAPKVGAELLGAFGVLALVLAAIGTYGVMSYSVSQRTQEIGIRMALGAQRRDVLRLILANGFAMILAGIVVGLIFSTLLTKSMNSLLFGIGAFDPLSFFATAALLLAAALFACWLPARRAMRVDPIIALRYE